MKLEMKHPTSNIQHPTPIVSRIGRSLDVRRWTFDVASFFIAAVIFFGELFSASADTILFSDGVIHTVSNGTITNGAVLIESNKITGVYNPGVAGAVKLTVPSDATFIDLHGAHLYPGLIAVDSALGLSEIDAVRATLDTTEVGDFTPDVQSWIAVNSDSELLPVTRANGIAYFEPTPQGKILSGQSALMSMDGWTWEEMLVKKPLAMHVFWPELALDTTPKERLADPSKAKSLEDQDKERMKKIRSLADFFEQARAYAKAKDADAKDGRAFKIIPAWEAMLPVVHGELPVIIHADEIRQIKSAVNWAATNQIKTVLADGRDAWMCAELLATNKIPVIYENIFTPPTRDTESYDVHFAAPEVLRKAGATVIFGTGYWAPMSRNLPYSASQAIAFGLPEEEALKGLTLYPAEIFGVTNQIGSIDAGKDATLFICDGSIFDLRANVKRMWIAGHEISLENRHTRLYEKYQNRPKP
jgi:imidazolonepropionase-like amidohydrolase